MSYFYRHDRVDTRDPWPYVAKCDCRRLLIVPLTDRMLGLHPAPWWFAHLYDWRIEDSRVRCPVCVAHEDRRAG